MLLNTMRWAYGVTTVPQRRNDLLPRTLRSLYIAGFTQPRLFVDGSESHRGWEVIDGKEYEVTLRYPAVKTYGNWILALWELYVREPAAHRYAVFQDDFVTYRNLRAYLEMSPYPEKGYLNLYTFPSNQSWLFGIIGNSGCVGWYESRELGNGEIYHGKRQQTGRGAVALVFNRDAVQALLCHQHMVEKPADANYGYRKVDGGVVQAMNQAGWREYVHNPSLVQHTGHASSMGNLPHKQAESFRGEDFDALELLRGN